MQSQERLVAARAAQVAIALNQQGKLRSYGPADVAMALTQAEQYPTVEHSLTPELHAAIRKRVGQMIALLEVHDRHLL